MTKPTKKAIGPDGKPHPTGLPEQVDNLDQWRSVDRLDRFFGSDEFIGIEQIGGDMQGIHRADARFRGLLPCVAQNRLQIVKKGRSPK